MDANAWIITSADVTFSDIFRIFAYFIGNWVMVVSLGSCSGADFFCFDYQSVTTFFRVVVRIVKTFCNFESLNN